MGSCIELKIDELALDYGKNDFWNNHAQLFQACDYSPTLFDDDDDSDCYLTEEPVNIGGRYERPLGQMLGRLDLLGYSEDACRAYMRNNISHVLENDFLEDGDHNNARIPIDNDWVISVLSSVRIDLIGQAQREFSERALARSDEQSFKQAWLKRIQVESKLEYIPASCFEDLLNSLHLSFDYFIAGAKYVCDPYVVLRLLGANKANLHRRVKWDHSDLVMGGWANTDDFLPYLDPANQFLVVTEGSSDAAVLKKSLEELRPDIVDFFYFVDMVENYPFTGTGNLFRFAQGLSSIRIQNKVVILYDNDAEGCFNYDRTVKLNRPAHLGVIKLPDLEIFKDYPTVGPEGSGRSDINGRAVSIELFLKAAKDDEVPVRWIGYHNKSERYHGVINNKKQLFKRFLSAELHTGDFPRLNYLLDALVSEATRISAITS